MSSWVSDIVIRAISRMPNEITEPEAEFLNSLPADEVTPALKILAKNEEVDRAIRSRAFDALLKLNDFDKINYLIELYEESPQRWGGIVSRTLSSFPDKKAVEKLCDMLRNDSDPTVRYNAAESLATIGDESAHSTLRDVAAHDLERNYAGHIVADMASYAIKQIKERLEIE